MSSLYNEDDDPRFGYLSEDHKIKLGLRKQDIINKAQAWLQQKETEDNINHPAHYNHNHKGIECIQAMEAMLTPEEFIGYLRGNIFKYQWRFRYKNGREDLAKADFYKKMLDDRYNQLADKD